MKLVDETSGQVLDITPRQLEWLHRMSALDEVGDPEITDEHRFNSRRKLFEQVDRQIRARIAQELPGMLSEHRERFEATLGADKIQTRMNQLRERVDHQIRTTAERFDATVDGLVSDALRKIAAYHVDELAARARKAIGSVVTKEVARQLAALLKVTATAPRVLKITAKKKAKRR